MKPSQLKELLSKTIPAGLPVMIVGPPGVGKSDIVSQATSGTETELIVSHPVVDDPIDYKGLPGIIDGNAEFLPFGNLRKLVEAKKRTVCFLDDLGQAPPSVQAAAMQLILARRVNGHTVSPHVTFLAATNRKQDRAGVSGILEPVKSRFSAIIQLEPDMDDWIKWALSNNVPTELIAFIRFRPNLLFDFTPTADMTNSPCPRTVANVGKLMQIGIPKDLEYETFTGAAGEGFAAEFVGFLKIFRNLPNPDGVLMNPDSAKVPDDPATMYALCGALAARVSKNNMDRLCKYADRIPCEFNVLLMQDAVHRTPELQETRSFMEWASKNKEILF